MRSLAAEEKALWERVTATIRPLSREPRAASGAVSPPPPPTNAAPMAGLAPRPRAPARAAASPKPPPPPPIANSLDSHWDRRLRAGQVAIDRTIDLHGCTLDRAWTAIDRGLADAIDAGERVILLITGHQRAGEPPVARGKIRAAVNDWLGASRHSGRIAAVRGAHPRHGGGGSLYLILSRR